MFDRHLGDEKHENYDNIVNFLLHLAICHTVLILEEEDPRTGLTIDKYSAQSPDELALINAAKNFGVEFKLRPSPRQINIEMKLPNDDQPTTLKF